MFRNTYQTIVDMLKTKIVLYLQSKSRNLIRMLQLINIKIYVEYDY